MNFTKEVSVTLSDLILVRNIRTVLGVGVGLLLAARLSGAQRRAVGWSAVLASIAIGAPFAVGFISRLRSQLEPKQVPERRAPQSSQAQQVAVPS
jgi:hypothetical protein